MKDIQILLVDDEERFVQNLAKLMKPRGFKVFTAGDGMQALDRLAAQKEIAVVVLDVCMPGMDGLETLRRIKDRHADVEVIMLTGRATLKDGVQALRFGAFDYLQKPCDIEELIAKVETVCQVEQIRRHPVMWPRRRAGDILLSGFLPLAPKDDLSRAMEIFSHYGAGKGARMLFVVDDQYRIQGTLSRDDLLSMLAKRYPEETITWEWAQRRPECLQDMPVQACMRRETSAVSLKTSLSETARLMLNRGWDSIPVVFDGRVLGIVRLQDALQHLKNADETATSC